MFSNDPNVILVNLQSELMFLMLLSLNDKSGERRVMDLVMSTYGFQM